MTEEHPFEEDAPLAELDAAEATGAAAEPVEDAAGAAAETAVGPAVDALRRLVEQLDSARDQHLRLAADFDNFRKRVAKERVEMGDRAQAALVSRLLDVLDDLDRIAAFEPGSAEQPLQEAVELVDRKLRKELEAAGLERVDPAGTPFDPQVAEAVSVVAPPEPSQEHHVALTFQVGYRFKSALVRPARVQVYSGEESA